MSKAELPVRHWRWMWLGEVIRLLSVPFLLVLTPVYLGALGLVRGLDWLGNKMYVLRLAFYIADKRKSGWEPAPGARAPAPELSREWKERAGG